MARTNLHELANRLLASLQSAATEDKFEGKLREVAAEAGLNSVRSAEAVKLLEDLGRVEIVQRGRRGRDTVILIRSQDPISLQDAEAMLPSRSGRRTTRINYEDLGRAVVDRLLELAKDDALRAAQVEAFASASDGQGRQIKQLEDDLENAKGRETELRIKLKAAEEALDRAEQNLRRAFGGDRQSGDGAVPVEDADAKAVLDILRSGRV